MTAPTSVVVLPTETTVTIVEETAPAGLCVTEQTVEVGGPAGIEVVEVALQGPSGSEEDMALAKRVDFVSDTLIYRGEALPGTAASSAAWRIKRISIAGDDDVTEEWADGAATYSQVWDDRASLDYS